MLERATSHWYLFLIRGLLLLIVGVIALSVPGITALTLGILFAAYVFVSGIAGIVMATRMSHEGSRWGWMLFGGIVSVLFGAVALVFPALALLYLSFIVAIWAILIGIAEIGSAWQLRPHLPGEWLWVIAGVLSVVFGLVVFAEPAAGLFFIVYAAAFYAILAGITFVVLAFRLRAQHGRGRSTMATSV